MFTDLQNFAIGVVASAPSPATSGTSLDLGSGQGARFPKTPFMAVIGAAPSASDPFLTPANAEIVRVDARATDTLTIVRAQEGSTARSVVVGDVVAAVLTAGVLDTIAGSWTQVAQTAHGLSVGDWVRIDGSGDYVLAQADTVANAETVGMVVAVFDANSFVVCGGGHVETGLSGLTAGEVYFLSAATAGEITATEPSANGEISKPVLIADSATSGWLFNMRGAVVANTPSFSGVSVAKTSDQAVGAGGTATISWNTDSSEGAYDEGGFWNAGQPTRLTAPEDGKYHVSYAIARTTGGELAVTIQINGDTTRRRGVAYVAANTSDLSGGADIDLEAGEYVEILTFSTAAYTLDGTSNNRCRADMHKIGGVAGPQGEPGSDGAGEELAYEERTTSLTVTGTNEANAVEIVAADAVALDGSTAIWVEFFTPNVTLGSGGANCHIWLYDAVDGGAAASIGRLADMSDDAASNFAGTYRRRLTPAAGSHVFSARASSTVGTDPVFSPGAGGAGATVPIYIRVTRV